MLTKEQSKMARAALGWSTRELAAKAGVSPSTVNQFEQEIVASNRSTIAAIRRAFEDAGIIFIDGNGEGPGVRMRRK